MFSRFEASSQYSSDAEIVAWSSHKRTITPTLFDNNHSLLSFCNSARVLFELESGRESDSVQDWLNNSMNPEESSMRSTQFVMSLVLIALVGGTFCVAFTMPAQNDQESNQFSGEWEGKFQVNGTTTPFIRPLFR